jgi:dTDP-glucose 4,6-dehydratase
MNPLARDLDHVLAHTEPLWEELRGKRIFITGGTGFFGCWLLESFTWANDRLGLDASAVVLTRNAAAFGRKAPHLAQHRSVHLHSGEVTSFDFPSGGFSHVIHAATEASKSLNEGNPLLMMDAIVQGTHRVLDFAAYCGAAKLLFASSGAVYGTQPSSITHLSEDYPGGPDTLDVSSAYGEGKRAAELLCALYSREHVLQCKIARGFAFVGPYLPLEAHFAIGNFIRDCIRNIPIRIQGDGTPYRSYMYAADLAIWLWTILIQGESCRPYNVGSEAHVTVADLASVVADTIAPGNTIEVQAERKPGSPQRYVPSTQRAREELNLKELIPLEDAIRRTFDWHMRERQPA